MTPQCDTTAMTLSGRAASQARKRLTRSKNTSAQRTKRAKATACRVSTAKRTPTVQARAFWLWVVAQRVAVAVAVPPDGVQRVEAAPRGVLRGNDGGRAPDVAAVVQPLPTQRRDEARQRRCVRESELSGAQRTAQRRGNQQLRRWRERRHALRQRRRLGRR